MGFVLASRAQAGGCSGVGKFGGYGAHRLIQVFYGKAAPEENSGDTCCPSSVNTGVHGDAWAIRIAKGRLIHSARIKEAKTKSPRARNGRSPL